ncbi:MAG: hypothetical protein M3343_07885 [Actinomycetota bacterium]|nr:hypothetical protein [Actinomycetota bacterium]
MFVTRAGRHDKADLKDFIESVRGGEVDTSQGTAMIAREGAIVGCIRLIEVEPGTLVYDDVLIAPDTDAAVAGQLIQAAMNNQGGTIYTAAPEAEVELFAALGFAAIEPGDEPPSVAAYWDGRSKPGQDPVHLRAR